MVIAGIDFADLLFGFQGRINRAKFWLAVLVYFIVNLLISLIQYALDTIGAILAVVVGIALFISGIAVALKRLHDRNRPGWWLVIFYVAPLVLIGIGVTLAVFSAVASDNGAGGGIAATIFYVAGAGIGIWAFVELGCLRGTIGPNQYGPDPLGNP